MWLGDFAFKSALESLANNYDSLASKCNRLVGNHDDLINKCNTLVSDYNNRLETHKSFKHYIEYSVTHEYAQVVLLEALNLTKTKVETKTVGMFRFSSKFLSHYSCPFSRL